VQCTRCREELPENTPICPACGPILIGAGFGSSLPVAAPAAPAIALAAGAPSPLAGAVPAVEDSRDAVRERARQDAKRQDARRPPGGGREAKRGNRERPRPAALASVERRPVSGNRAVPGPVAILAAADLVSGLALAALVVAILGASGAGEDEMMLALRSFLGAAGMLAAALGLLLLKPFGRTMQLVVAGYSVLVQGSTLAAILIVIYMARPAMSRLFQGLPDEGSGPRDGATGRGWTLVAATAGLFQGISSLLTMARGLPGP
jgi:hypothetical protein